MSDVENKMSRTGADLFEDWERCAARLQEADREQTRASFDLEVAVEKFGRWMTFGDAVVGEKTSVWYGSELVTVKVLSLHPHQFEITKKKRPTS